MALSIKQARRREGADVTVRGFVVVEGGVARLCAELLESSPPQCGGEELELVGLPPEIEGGLQWSGETAWSRELSVISGRIVDGRLIVS